MITLPIPTIPHLRCCTRFFLIFFITGLLSCSGKTGKTDISESRQTAKNGSAAQDTLSPIARTPLTADPAKEQVLQEAALNGKIVIVENLIGEGVNVNATDPDNRTALMYASFNGHQAIVQKLLDSGAEVSLRDVSGRTALLYAATGPFPETVKLLLENNSDPNIVDAEEHFSPIMHAAAEGQLEVVKILLEYGADASLKDVDGDNAYQFAVQNGHTAVADILKDM